MFDKLIELINSSTKIGFALFFAAAVIFVGQYYHQWPFTLLQDQLGYVLLGAWSAQAFCCFSSFGSWEL